MSNPNSKVTFRSSPKRKRSSVNEPLDVGSPTPAGFKAAKYLKQTLVFYFCYIVIRSSKIICL